MQSNQETQMVTTAFSLAFFESIIDYAGLFPPAKLSLNQALKNYRRYIHGEDNWILSHFIIPQDLLSELNDDLLAGFTAEEPLRISLISSNPANDLKDAIASIDKFKNRVVIGSIETKISADDNWLEIFEQNQRALEREKLGFHIYYELAEAENWDVTMPRLIENLGRFAENALSPVAFKLRCGGVESQMIPSCERVAQAIIACREAMLPLKFTAGLHHPFRHFNKKLEAYFHGYANLFLGAMLAHEKKLSVAQLSRMIKETENQNVLVNDDSFSWLGYNISTETIRELRKKSIISFGSCSFIEPIEDARRLGWL